MFEKFRIAQAKEQLEILNKQISSKQQELIEIEHKINSAKEDVFDIEAKLHKRLDSARVNKMNRNKEFFYGSSEEAIKILKEEFKVDVHFVDENWVEEE